MRDLNINKIRDLDLRPDVLKPELVPFNTILGRAIRLANMFGRIASHRWEDTPETKAHFVARRDRAQRFVDRRMEKRRESLQH